MSKMLPGIDLEWLKLSDRDLAVRVIAHWMSHVAETEGVNPHSLSKEDAADILALMSRVETDNDPELERIFHLFAEGNLDRGGRLFRRYMKRQAAGRIIYDEAKTGKRKQKGLAKKPRAEALQSIIDEIVKNNKKIAFKELIESLRDCQGPDSVIDEVDDEGKCVVWRPKRTERKTRNVSFKALQNRLTAAKKKFPPS